MDLFHRCTFAHLSMCHTIRPPAVCPLLFNPLHTLPELFLRLLLGNLHPALLIGRAVAAGGVRMCQVKFARLWANMLSLCITLFAWLDHSNNSLLLSSANVSKTPLQEFGSNSEETFNIPCYYKTDSGSECSAAMLNTTAASESIGS